MLLSASVLQAQINEDDISREKMVKPEQPKPFKIKVYGDTIGKAEIDKHGFKHQHLKYSDVGVDAACGFYYNPEYKEGAFAELGYNLQTLDWHHNIFFRKKHFQIVSLSVGGVSERVKDWKWQAQATINVNVQHFNISEYANYDMILWGRYAYCEDIGVHIGLYAETGMKIDRVYPVIGFDWEINDKWKLNCVFPFNISLVYTFRKCWTAFLAYRSFELRQRLGKHEPLYKGLVIYRNNGAEIGVSQECTSWMTANIHAGVALGGQFKVADQHYHHRKHFDLDRACYFGGEFNARF